MSEPTQNQTTLPERLSTEQVRGSSVKRCSRDLRRTCRRFQPVQRADETLVASHDTVTARLTEGAELGLWREVIAHSDAGDKTELYELMTDT